MQNLAVTQNPILSPISILPFALIAFINGSQTFPGCNAQSENQWLLYIITISLSLTISHPTKTLPFLSSLPPLLFHPSLRPRFHPSPFLLVASACSATSFPVQTALGPPPSPHHKRLLKIAHNKQGGEGGGAYGELLTSLGERGEKRGEASDLALHLS